jgi:hypothetical protein
MPIKQCKCGRNNYEWMIDDFSRSWLRCSDCGSNFFDDEIGVILINWRCTDISHIRIEDVLISNTKENGVVSEHYQ